MGSEQFFSDLEGRPLDPLVEFSKYGLLKSGAWLKENEALNFCFILGGFFSDACCEQRVEVRMGIKRYKWIL